jgi:predicted nucleic acid-binding protein
VNFLLDTNVVSETVKPRPNSGIINWLANADEDNVFISVVTFTEIRYGIERMPAGRRRKQLGEWLEVELPLRFAGRILPIDAVVADACGRVVARSEALGRPIEPRDAFIAATAEVHQLVLVTRNVSDFQPALKAILNPWV